MFGLNQAAMAVTTTLLPVFPSLWVICLLSTIQGIGLGALDAGMIVNDRLHDLRLKKSRP